jgi:hypothetical protein
MKSVWRQVAWLTLAWAQRFGVAKQHGVTFAQLQPMTQDSKGRVKSWVGSMED